MSEPNKAYESTHGRDLRFCTCVTCGKKMYLVFDVTNGGYLALCPVCHEYSALPENPGVVLEPDRKRILLQ